MGKPCPVAPGTRMYARGRCSADVDQVGEQDPGSNNGFITGDGGPDVRPAAVAHCDDRRALLVIPETKTNFKFLGN